VANPHKRKKSKLKAAGLPPGSVVFTGHRKVEQVRIHHVKYDAQHYAEKDFQTPEGIECPPDAEAKVDWFDVRGLHDTAVIESFGKIFDIHPLILEDIASVDQLPKFEEYLGGIFITLRALSFDQTTLEVKTEQVAIYFKNGLLLSFQEDEADLFFAVRERIRGGNGRVRRKGADYLAYSLIDNIVDNYFTILDEVGETVDLLEATVLTKPNNMVKGKIHHLKKELLLIRKSITPLREAMGLFARSEHDHITENTDIYVRDIYDHTIQVVDMVETYRDILNGLQDLYLSEITYKMNQIMQVLTVVTTLFVPITFLTSLYGMNFVNMPELRTHNGYFVLLFVMAFIVLGLLMIFKRNRWI
jgi:magnesium transporter